MLTNTAKAIAIIYTLDFDGASNLVLSSVDNELCLAKLTASLAEHSCLLKVYASGQASLCHGAFFFCKLPVKYSHKLKIELEDNPSSASASVGLLGLSPKI